MKEYMIHIWGGAWNSDVSPSIEKDYGIKEGYHYFGTKEELDDFCRVLNKRKYSKQGLVRNIEYGVMSHKRTIFVATLKYKKKEFTIHYDFGYEYPEDSAKYMFLEGDDSCDCNRSLFIRREYGEESILELSCGNSIELINYYFEYVD